MENGSKKNIDISINSVDSLHDVITQAEHAMAQKLGSVRKKFIGRYPALFLLIVTTTLALVIYAKELFLVSRDWAQNYFWIVSVLATGAPYKKLS
jgi:hypothetical protein